MLVIRLGEVHQDDCETLSTTNDWLPLDEFAEDSLNGMDLRCCTACIDGPTVSSSVAERSREDRDERAAEREQAARAVPQR